MDPIGLIFMGITLLLVFAAIVLPQLEQRRKNDQK